jgi:hypothetical protein
MKTLKRIGAALALSLIVTVVAFGDGPLPPCDPGETHGPPCSSASLTADESTDAGQMLTPSEDSVDLVSVADAALTAMLIF